MQKKKVFICDEIFVCAINLIDEEIKLIKFKMEHPQYFIKKDPLSSSPIFWSNNHPKIWLIEILCAITQVGSIVNSDGTKASFALVLRCFEEFLNIKLGEPQNVKRAVFNRKIDLTKYTDKLRNALIEHYDNI